MELYVGNLSFHSTEESLRETFMAFGQVEKVQIITDRDTGRSRGFAFVTMATAEEGQAVIDQLHGKEIDGRVVTINQARGRETRPRFSGGNFGGPRRSGSFSGSRGGGYGERRGGGGFRGRGGYGDEDRY